MRPTLRDADTAAALERDGYVAMPFLDADEVAALRALYDGLGPAPDDPRTGCISSYQSADAAYKTATQDGIMAVIRERLEAVCDRQVFLPAQFLIKWPGAGGNMPMHQDTSLVDESVHRSCELWVALEDTSSANGELWMVPGSHRWLSTVRGLNSWFHPPFDSVEDRIRDRHAVAVPVRAGDAILFDHATLHFSLTNDSARERVVIITDVLPEEAAPILYWATDEGAAAYELGDRFWFDSTPSAFAAPPPAAPVVDVRTADWPVMTDVHLDALVASGAAFDRLRGSTRAPATITAPSGD
jgi:hypothetical protein